MVTKEFLKTFKDEVNRLLVEQEYQKKKDEINTTFQNTSSEAENAYLQALIDLESDRSHYLNSYDYFLPENNYALPDFNTHFLSSTFYSTPTSYTYPVSEYENDLTIPSVSFSNSLDNPLSQYCNQFEQNDVLSFDTTDTNDNSLSEDESPLASDSFLSSKNTEESLENEPLFEEEFPLSDISSLAENAAEINIEEDENEQETNTEEDENTEDNYNNNQIFITSNSAISEGNVSAHETPQSLSEEPIELVRPTILTQNTQPLLSSIPVLKESNEETQEPIQTQASIQTQEPIQTQPSGMQQTLADLSQPTTFYKTDILPQQKKNDQTDAFIYEQKKNMMVRIAEWIQNNIFNMIGDHIPILGTVIKMIGNVFTGLFKTIGNLFDGNFKNALSDGLSWLKDSAIIGGSAFGIYKLGKEFDWWGKKKSSSTSTLISNQNTVTDTVQKAVNNAITQNTPATTQSIISGVATPVSENTSTDAFQNLLVGKINQYDK